MAWRMSWSWPWELGNTFKNNFNDGYQFGDVVKSLFGVRDETGFGSMADPGNVWDEVGNAVNGITGNNSANAYNSAQAVASRDFTHNERLETQDYNSAEAVKAWERSEESAQRARDFELQQDNTALQRRMADAQAAGLNPMMLVSGSGLNAGFSGTTAGTSTAASVSPGTGANATAAGNSASAVAGLIRAITTLVKAA